MFRIVCIAVGYLIGCIQSAYFVGKIWKVDIRTKGSGNLGTTNALRVLGKKAGAVTFVCDLMKSVAAFWICMALFPEEGLICGVLGSFGAVLGHDFPFYLKFKGGKGIAASIGMMLCIGGPAALITYGIGIAGLCSRYVSVGSLCFIIPVPFVLGFLGYGPEITFVGALMAILAVYQHKENIIRLKNGNENRLGQKRPNREEV